MKNKKIVIDIDGTICEEKPTFEKCLAKIKPGAKEFIKKLKLDGNFIILYTARSWSEYNMTKDWLSKNNISYDLLMCGKPTYDIWIDDRAIKFLNWDSLKTDLLGERKNG